MSSVSLKIATPEKVIYENTEVLSVSIPTATGQITVLPNHAPLISVLQAGEMTIRDKNGEHVLALAGGFLEIKKDSAVLILADNAERAEEIDVARAEQAKQRAVVQMQDALSRQDVDYAKLQAVLEREMNRIRIGRKYKKMPRIQN